MLSLKELDLSRLLRMPEFRLKSSESLLSSSFRDRELKSMVWRPLDILRTFLLPYQPNPSLAKD